MSITCTLQIGYPLKFQPIFLFPGAFFLNKPNFNILADIRNIKVKFIIKYEVRPCNCFEMVTFLKQTKVQCLRYIDIEINNDKVMFLHEIDIRLNLIRLNRFKMVLQYLKY